MARRMQIPVSINMDLGSDMISLNAPQTGREDIKMSPAMGYGLAKTLQFLPQNGGFKVAGQVNHTVMVDFEYPDASAAINAMTLPDLRAHKSNLMSAHGIIITIIGSGGTGGYVIRDMLRFLQSLKNKGDTRQFAVNLVDADIVEDKNLIRQNFIAADVQQKKAVVLARRYGNAFGIPVIPRDMMINRYNDLHTIKNDTVNNVLNLQPGQQVREIIIGCVDNHAARRVIRDYLINANSEAYWIDSGNERMSGQVALGYAGVGAQFRAHYAGRNLEHTKALMRAESNYPLPTVNELYPEINDPKQDLIGSDDTSCAERALQDEQNIFINMSAAMHVLNYLRQVVMSENIMTNSIVFDVKGLSQVTNLTPENINKILK